MTASVVITDANVLINFACANAVDLLVGITSLRFCVPEEVLAEITDDQQRGLIDAAIAAQQLDTVAVDSIDALEVFAELRDIMGHGEAACLALAATTDFLLASDEKRLFRRKAIELIGEARLLRTEDIILTAIRSGCISVEAADALKATLELKRYTMPFASFGDLL